VRQQGPAASGIIYCLSRNEAEGVAGYLRDAGRLSAEHYHAGMSHKQRMEVQNAWQAGRVSVIVATIAFGGCRRSLRLPPLEADVALMVGAGLCVGGRWHGTLHTGRHRTEPGVSTSSYSFSRSFAP
jgi:hypothetical protein